MRYIIRSSPGSGHSNFASKRVKPPKPYVLDKLSIFGNSIGACIACTSSEILDAHYIHPNETVKIAGILGNIEWIKVWVMFIEEMDIIRVRLRSKGVVINTIAEKYNGGGHPLSAGASVLTWEEAEQVVNDLEQLLEKH